MYDEDLIDLEDGIRRLKVEYDVFFNGHRKKPPEDLRFRVEKLIKRLSESSLNFQERFRYNTLVGRYCIYRDLWRRSQTERELSAGSHEDAPRAQLPLPLAQAQEPAEKISVSFTDPEKEEEKVRQLYDALLRMRGRDSKHSPPLSYQQFTLYIVRQARGIRDRLGCASVEFTLALQEDAIRFIAKPGNAA